MSSKLATLIATVICTALMSVSSAFAGGCGGGGYHAKSYSSYNRAAAAKQRRAQVLATAQSRKTERVASKDTTEEVASTTEKTASSETKSDETKTDDTKVASADVGCMKFIASVGQTIPVECPKEPK